MMKKEKELLVAMLPGSHPAEMMDTAPCSLAQAPSS